MAAVWFALLTLVLGIYVVADGFDFGAGALHTRVAREDRERRQVLAAIGPYWDGNEVWLLAMAGILFLAFPTVLAAALSGLYLPMFMLLWVLILRGISIEFRSHLPDRMWRAFWDTTFEFASTLAPVLLGVALGNVVRGVPLGADGWFALPLFASFSPHGDLGVLDWYSLAIGALAYVAILHHGALFLAWKTDGAVRERALRRARISWWATLVGWGTALAATANAAPHVFAGWEARPVVWVATAVFVSGLVASRWARQRGRDGLAFIGSAAFLAGLLAAVAASLYPTLLRSSLDPQWSLTAANAAASPRSLRLGLLWWPIAFGLAGVYFVVLFRLHRGKAQPAADGEGY